MSKKKVIALLELTGDYIYGNKYVDSFNYYWSLYPAFITFQIVDNKNDIPYIIELLNKYYQEGYRIFFGPINSRNINGVISWFSDPAHSDVTCLIPIGVAISLILPSNMYRLQPSEFYFLDYIKEATSVNITRVFYFYNSHQLACTDLLKNIQTLYGPTNVIIYDVTTDADLNTNDVQTFFTTNNINPTSDIVIQFLIDGNQKQIYFELFKTIDFEGVKQYDILPLNFKYLTNDVNNLYNNYYIIFFESITNTSILNESINNLGLYYAFNSLTSLYLLSLFANNENINNAYSFGEVLPWFDDKNGIKYWSYNIYLYDSNGFTKTNIYLNDPINGILTFNKKV